MQTSNTCLFRQQSLQYTTVGCVGAYMQRQIAQENILVACVIPPPPLTVVCTMQSQTHTERKAQCRHKHTKWDVRGWRTEVWKRVGREVMWGGFPLPTQPLSVPSPRVHVHRLLGWAQQAHWLSSDFKKPHSLVTIWLMCCCIRQGIQYVSKAVAAASMQMLRQLVQTGLMLNSDKINGLEKHVFTPGTPFSQKESKGQETATRDLKGTSLMGQVKCMWNTRSYNRVRNQACAC